MRGGKILLANINIKGIWIPVQILLNQELNDKEKIILSLILFFSREKNCCDIRNEQFSELVLVKEDRVSRLFSSLKEKGYLNVKYNYKEESKKITSRVIMPIAEKIGCYNDLMGIVENDNKDSSKHQPPIGENAKDIKNNINNKYIKNNENHFKGYIPYRDKNNENLDYDKFYIN